MTRQTLTAVLVVAVVAVFATVVIASTIGGDSPAPSHVMQDGQSMTDEDMGGANGPSNGRREDDGRGGGMDDRGMGNGGMDDGQMGME
ncbi:MAG: hypothetical protein WAP37_00955 [Solirubrobacterales bacterium]